MNLQQISRINDVLYKIHQDISRDLSAKSLAEVAAFSEQHFHRVFKKVVGESVHQYIRRTRMEYAANQLMFDSQTTVLDIAHKSGFNSVSSFSRAFKSQFQVTPGEWRKEDRQVNDKPYLKDSDVAAGYQRVANLSLPQPIILEVSERFVAYIRHVGYGRSIKKAWYILQAWAHHEGRDFSKQFGLHHSNPALVELHQCRYVACIAIDTPIKVRSVVNQLVIPGGLHAVFPMQGVYGELLPQISQVWEQWLPNSGFKLGATPAYVHYHKNHFIEDDEHFELDFYLPIGFF